MGRRYTITFTGVAISAQQDLWSLKALDDQPITIISGEIFNVGINADVGDAKEQTWGIIFVRGNTTIGSGGSNPTARATEGSNSLAFGPTTNVRVNDTTKISGGTALTLYSSGFNTRVGWYYKPIPEERFVINEGNGFFAIQLNTTPSEAITMSGTLQVDEG